MGDDLEDKTDGGGQSGPKAVGNTGTKNNGWQNNSKVRTVRSCTWFSLQPRACTDLSAWQLLPWAIV